MMNLKRHIWRCFGAPALASGLWAVTLLGAEPSGASLSGVDHFNAHRFARAAAVFEAALKSDPANLEALIYLGRIAFEENRLGDAAAYFERATLAAPQSSSAFHWLGRVNGVQARELGAPRGVGPARRTRKALEKAVQLNPNNLEARVELATFYREAPGIVGGSKRAALAEVEEINKRDPYLGALVKGDLELGEKKYEEAEAQYRAAVRLHPNEAEAHFRLGVLHQRAGRPENAFSEFETALRLDPNDKRPLFQIGKTADLSGKRLGRGEEALQAYLQCQPFFIMPKLSWAHRRLGNIYLKKGQPDAARKQYVAALELEPNDKEAASALRQLEASQRAPK